MGGDAQFESLVQIRNTSKPPRFGLLKNINKFMRLAFVRFERVGSFNRPRNLASPLCVIAVQEELKKYYG